MVAFWVRTITYKNAKIQLPDCPFQSLISHIKIFVPHPSNKTSRRTTMAPPPLAAADPPAVDDNADAGSPLLQQPGIDSINAPGQVKRYFTCLLAMMRHKDGINYPKSKVFTVDELAAVRPEHVARYFCKRVFGTETPTQNSIPTKRKTTVSYWKKGISYFMPSQAPWTDAAGGYGNPTRSKLVNNVLAAMEKAETRGTGAKEKKDRAFTAEEFVQAHDLLGTFWSQYGRQDNLRYQALIKLQLHMLGRSDDMAHLKKDCIQRSGQFPEFITCQMKWSKNVTTASDCPKQIVFASKNPKYCAVLGLALFLEKWIRSGVGIVSQWLFADGSTDASDPVDEQNREAFCFKKTYYNILKKHVIDNDAFVRDEDLQGPLGTHSIKKYGASWLRKSQVSKDDVDYRARWKNKRIQDTYVETQLDWPDYYAASKLCEGGVIVYRIKEGVGITDNWLLEKVCPYIYRSFSKGVALVMAKALLWAAFDDDHFEIIPRDIRDDIRRDFTTLNTGLEDNVNPVEKLDVIVDEYQGTVSLDVIPSNADQWQAGGTPTEGAPQPGQQQQAGGRIMGGGDRMSIQWRNAVYAKVSSTNRVVAETRQTQLAKLTEIERRLDRLERMVRGVITAPARLERTGQYIVGHAREERPATLMKCPRTLAILWDEYWSGINGSKPARDFTARERGAVKFRYCRRKIVWDCIQRMLNNGAHLKDAIERIHSVYGNVCVTTIINRMSQDERNGGHHRLRV